MSMKHHSIVLVKLPGRRPVILVNFGIVDNVFDTFLPITKETSQQLHGSCSEQIHDEFKSFKRAKSVTFEIFSFSRGVTRTSSHFAALALAIVT